MSANPRHQIIHLSLAGIFLLLGVAGFSILAGLKKPVLRNDAADARPLLGTTSVKPASETVLVRAFAETRARQRSVIRAEVAGVVHSVHANLLQGGVINKGEAILTIDPTPYEISLQRAQAQVLRAEALLEQRQIETSVSEKTLGSESRTLKTLQDEATRYLDMFGKGSISKMELDQKTNQVQRQEVLVQTAESRYLVQPGLLKQAQAELASARSQLQQAEFDLRRTSVLAPFTGYIVRESVETGQFAQAGSDLGEILSLENLELAVPVASHDLNFLSLAPDSLPQVRINVLTPKSHESYSAAVTRLAPELSAKSRTREFVVEIAQDGVPDQPILPGSYCEVILSGKILPNLFRVPRLAMRSGKVQTVQDGKIRWLDAVVVREEGDTLLMRIAKDQALEIVLVANEALRDGDPVRTFSGTRP